MFRQLMKGEQLGNPNAQCVKCYSDNRVKRVTRVRMRFAVKKGREATRFRDIEWCSLIREGFNGTRFMFVPMFLCSPTLHDTANNQGKEEEASSPSEYAAHEGNPRRVWKRQIRFFSFPGANAHGWH
ncbi:uncharacterized protein BT62DRAFT_928826 [Guyanagaster necrorhizus]|uniref:Uncharacterized protein n=1 Tax=Guyanagaster necrorhizus TaxID=856835 RepID=A0A9P7W0L9_9AGAR|nr:uncharacterized protein BT62DRAFT_928826 [Guyanagaster necrorhizus MCA 3950]KAG7450038.1 hypothetical protein BT62DRAFT_928826 [Guyanagaster necrorhizus MCA 3950]